MSRKLVLAIVLVVAFAVILGPFVAQAESPPSTLYKVGFSQGVSASWQEKTPSGENVYATFYLSGGWSYSRSTHPSSSPNVTWVMKEYWYSFTRYSCPTEGGTCVLLTEDYGVVAMEDFTFEGNDKVTFSLRGYLFSFLADPTRQEGLTDEVKHNQQTDGPFCWYVRQNSMKMGAARLALPGGDAVVGRAIYSSVYTDWSVEYGEGRPYVPSCAPYVGGGKG